LGQFSILALLAAVLKYLFLDTDLAQNVAERTPPVSQPTTRLDGDTTHIEPESTEWLNALLRQVCRYYQPASAPLYTTLHLHNQVADVYRSKLRDDLQGVEGDEVLHRRVEDFVNLMRPSGVLVSTFL
jgi:maintenance of morphology protein 1